MIGEPLYESLLKQDILVQVSPDVVFELSSYNQMVERVRESIHNNGSITVAEARDLFDTSRKYVLGLLEYLDARGFTQRKGDERVLR
jgi:selenocysteine-specific elongation factor